MSDTKIPEETDYVLYGDLGSGSAIIELALAELKLRYTTHEINLDQAQQRSTSYQSINAHRKLPTLITPRGETWTETVAILLSLRERHNAKLLFPDPATSEHAQMLRWLLYLATELYPVIEMKDHPERFQPEGERTEPKRRKLLSAHYRELWKSRWLHVENAASNGPWFLADQFSALDLYIAVLSQWAQIDEWRQRHLPKIEGIARAVAGRASCSGVWSRHWS